MSRQVMSAIDFTFELLKRAFVVGAIQYGGLHLHSKTLLNLALTTKILLIVWTGDRVWAFYERVYQHREHSMFSVDWWFGVVSTLLASILVMGLLFGWLGNITAGLAK